MSIMKLRYLIFVIDIPNNRATNEEMQSIASFNANLRASDSLVMAAGIAGSINAQLVDARTQRPQITDGSLVSGNENYSGFWIIQCDSDEHALELAKAASRACNRRVELRPYL